MSLEWNGETIETTANGYLVNLEDWNEDLAKMMAAADEVEMTDGHWDVVNYLRDQYINNNQLQPNTRTIVKAMSEKWEREVDPKELYDLFPGDPSKQGGRIAGLPESRRKGGY